MMTRTEFMQLQARRRRGGKVIPPCTTPQFTTLPVTTPYGATSPPGNPWALGRHTGEDHAAPAGSYALATSWGRVVCVAIWTRPGVIAGRGPVTEWGDAYGTHLVIRTGDGRWDYALCHLSKTLVVPFQTVRPGMVLGLTGATGGDGHFGAHLHFEARPAGGRFGSDVNPLAVKRKATP